MFKESASGWHHSSWIAHAWFLAGASNIKTRQLFIHDQYIHRSVQATLCNHNNLSISALVFLSLFGSHSENSDPCTMQVRKAIFYGKKLIVGLKPLTTRSWSSSNTQHCLLTKWLVILPPMIPSFSYGRVLIRLALSLSICTMECQRKKRNFKTRNLRTKHFLTVQRGLPYLGKWWH